MVRKIALAIFILIRVALFFTGFILMMCETEDIAQQPKTLIIGVALIIVSLLPSLIKAAVVSWSDADCYLK